MTGLTTLGAVSPKDVPSMPPLPEWMAGYPRLRGVYGLSPADALALCSICTLEAAPRGTVIFAMGDDADAMYLVKSGHVAFRLSPSPEQGVIGMVAGPGMTFGQRALTTGGPRIGTAYAVDHAELIRLDRARFEDLRRERPGVERFLVEVVSTLVRYMTLRSDDLAESGADRRVHRRLLELAYAFGPEPPVMVPLSQDDLAALAGVTRSTVNGVLRAAAEQGWVGLGWRRLAVLDPAAIYAAPYAAAADTHAVPGGSSPTPA